MRVWLLTSELPPEVAGGIATYVEVFSRALARAGHDVVVFVPGPGTREDVVLPNLRVVRFASELGMSGAGGAGPAMAEPVVTSYALAACVLERARREGPPDVIEAQEHLALPYYLLQRRLTERTPIAETPILVHLHSPVFEILRANEEPCHRLPDYWIGQMEKFCILAADALLAPSRFLADRVKAVLDRDLDVSCIPLPLELPVTPPVAPRAGEVVAVGRLEVRKGVLPLVHACDGLWGSGATFRLRLVGGDRSHRSLATTVATHLRERYRRWFDDGRLSWTDVLPRADAVAAMAGAWTVVVPSTWENFPNTCMEAMGLGQVVVASRTGGQAEMVGASGEAGFVFDWAVEGDFEAKLTAAVALPALGRREIGEAARARIERLCAPETVLAARLGHFERLRERGVKHARMFPSVLRDPSPVLATAPPGEMRACLSVVVPRHDLGALLSETLTNIRATDHRPLEIVLVDDGSDDASSRALARELVAGTSADLHVVRTRDQGPPAVRTRGAEAARGEFLAFVGADDLVTPTFFSRAIEVLRRFDDVGFVYAWGRDVGDGDGLRPTWNAEFPYLLCHNMLAPTVVVRRAWFLAHARHRPELEDDLDDWEAWIRLAAAGAKGVAIPDPLVRYRVHTERRLRALGPDALRRLHERIAERNADVYGRWGAEVAALLNANGPGWRWNHPAVESREPPGVALGYDAALGERLVRRLRASRLGGLLLRSSTLRSAVRRALGV